MAAVACDHAGQQRARHVHETGDVGRDHPVPLRHVGFVRGLEAERQAGVVDEHVDLAPALGKRAGQGGDGLRVGDVEREGQHLTLRLLRQGLQPLGAPPRGDHAMAVGDEPPGDRRAEAGRRAGDEDRQCH